MLHFGWYYVLTLDYYVLDKKKDFFIKEVKLTHWNWHLKDSNLRGVQTKTTRPTQVGCFG